MLVTFKSLTVVLDKIISLSLWCSLEFSGNAILTYVQLNPNTTALSLHLLKEKGGENTMEKVKG